ncbi:MAG: hypothetical protein NTY67_04670 [Cyanobacteria bacterium]|nr:hypothetical protein [Cyanobacteriota bacterium]
MDSGYRRDYRSGDRGSEPRRPARESEPLEQRFDRWVSAGRQLVDGVAGSRPGSRAPARGGEGRGSARGGFDGLGRWVEERLDWFLEDGDDWREPWQESGGRGQSPAAPDPRQGWTTRGASTAGERSYPPDPALGAQPPRVAGGRRPADLSSFDRPRTLSNRPGPSSASQPSTPLASSEQPSQPPTAGTAPRRRLEALSRRGPAPRSADVAAPPDPEAWPDDDSFSLPRWQRPPAARRLPEIVLPPAPDSTETSGRPLPRSTRRFGPRF